MPNRETRRRNGKNQNQQQPGPTLEQLAAAVANVPPPIVINLDNCRVIVRDVPGADDGTKEMLFAHVSGGVVFRAALGTAIQKELATLLSAPPGIVIPSADTPAA